MVKAYQGRLSRGQKGQSPPKVCPARTVDQALYILYTQMKDFLDEKCQQATIL